jgi:excisionase family DNA binding protein
MEPTWISVRHYCERHGVNRQTIYKWIECGVVAHWRVGRVLRIRNLPPGEFDKEPLAEPAVWPAELPPAVKRRRTSRSNSMIRVGDTVVPDTPGVYVVRSQQAVKIGCSKTLRSRLGFMQTMFPHPIAIVGYISCPTFHDALMLEGVLHEACAEYRIRGEWFHFASPVAQRLRLVADAKWDERAMLH